MLVRMVKIQKTNASADLKKREHLLLLRVQTGETHVEISFSISPTHSIPELTQPFV